MVFTHSNQKVRHSPGPRPNFLCFRFRMELPSKKLILHLYPVNLVHQLLLRAGQIPPLQEAPTVERSGFRISVGEQDGSRIVIGTEG